MITRKKFDGMDLSIEVKAGSSRKGTNAKGEEWEQKIDDHYGYILGTHSPDGEHLDCYLAKNPKSGSKVYVVHQLTPDGSKFDEDKVMLGFPSESAAKSAFTKYTFKPKNMFGGISEFDLDHFKVVAYQASKSKAILAKDDVIKKIKRKVGVGIKTPEEIAKKVSENFLVRSKRDGSTIRGEISLKEARSFMMKLDPSVRELYEMDHADPHYSRMLFEGLVKGDLDGILIPRLSVNEYIAKDDTDNTVIAFFLKNCPEAVEPTREFAELCPGVLLADSGDSESMDNVSIVYVEFDKFPEFKDVYETVKQICMLARMDLEDLSVSFPHAKRSYPFDPEIVSYYLNRKEKAGI